MTEAKAIQDSLTRAQILLERCDSCRNRAYVMVELATGAGMLPLSFCGHHWSRNEAALAARGAKVLANELDLLLASETEVHA